MIRNYLKIALRQLRKQKGYAFINIAGLALGLACFILIGLYVQDELSYDRYHEHVDRIYRLEGTTDATVPIPWAPALVQDHPGVEKAVRFWHPFFGEPLLVRHGERGFYEKRFFFADSVIFAVFSFSLREGNPVKALHRPYTVVLTEKTAQRYFGEQDPIGKTLTLYWQGKPYPFEVTGILHDVPPTSHFRFDFLASFETLRDLTRDLPVNLFENWGNRLSHTYLLLSEHVSPAEIEAYYPVFRDAYFSEAQQAFDYRFSLKALPDIHLHSHLEEEIEPNGNVATVYILSVIALFVLLIACINYMNLATARSATRVREIAFRKVVGADRPQLIRQFLGESILASFVALALALLLVALSLPVFNDLVDKELGASSVGGVLPWMGVGGIALLVGLVSGSYPALILSAFRPALMLRGHLGTPGDRRLRQGFIVTQFSATVLLIIGTLTVHRQLEYMRHKDLGFDKEHMVVLPMRGAPLKDRYPFIKEAFMRYPGIVRASFSNGVPGQPLNVAGINAEGHPENEGLTMFMQPVDHDFVETFEMELVAGRNLSRDMQTDTSGAFLLNETAVRWLGWSSPEKPLGKRFAAYGAQGTVVGVIKDFHFQSLHHQVAPLTLYVLPDFFRVLSLRIRPDDPATTLAFLERTWRDLFPDRPFDYFFLDSEFDALLKADVRLGRILSYFTLLALLIACLGLFGLTAFTAEQRTKEIGIRKVLGASVPSIVLLLSKDVLRLMLLVFAVAAPVAYFAAQHWLAHFAYRVELSWGIFLVAGLATLLIAWLTVSYQAARAALTRPVKTLRYD